MITPSLSIAGVSERDIDLLLLEEFLSSSEFLRWFISHAISPDLSVEGLLNARRSVSQSTGESDLEVAFKDGEGNSIMLLIENKVNAGFQPQQAERYRERGTGYLECGKCTSFHTVLVAPDRFFGTTLNMKGFDTAVRYEAIRDWFANANSLGTRRHYKEMLLTAAIEKGTLGYQLVEDAPVTNFWKMYWQLAQAHAPELQMRKPKSKPAGAGFIYFDPTSLPEGIDIVHKLPHGNVDLQFAGMGKRLNELRTQFQHFVEPDMDFETAARSGSIRLRVPVLNTAIDFSKQEADAKIGLDAAKRLLAWFIKHQPPQS